MDRTPGDLEALEIFFSAILADLHVALPGRVESYDSDKQVANVRPMLQRVSRDQDDTRVAKSLPVLSAVPVAFPRGGGYLMTFPLVPGDTGLLVFAECDLGPWRATGQDSDPVDEGRHTLAGAVFHPGLHTAAGALPSRPGHLVLAKEGGPELHVGTSTVDVGAEGGNFIALANKVDAWFSAIHTAAGAANPAAFQAAVVAIALGSVAATKAKAT